MGLNNREISSLVWIFVFIAFLLWKGRKNSLEESLGNLLSAFFNTKIQVILLWGILWVVLCVQGLRFLGLWDFLNLKTTLLWGMSYAFVALIGASKIADERSYFKKSIREIFAVAVLIIFIVDAYSFSLIAELILVPFFALISMIHLYSAKKQSMLKYTN